MGIVGWVGLWGLEWVLGVGMNSPPLWVLSALFSENTLKEENLFKLHAMKNREIH